MLREDIYKYIFFVVLIRTPYLNVDILKSGLVDCDRRLNELHLAACLDGKKIYLKHRLQKMVSHKAKYMLSLFQISQNMWKKA